MRVFVLELCWENDDNTQSEILGVFNNCISAMEYIVEYQSKNYKEIKFHGLQKRMKISSFDKSISINFDSHSYVITPFKVKGE